MSSFETRWLDEASKEINIGGKTVAVDRFDTVFHDPDSLQSTIDMEKVDIDHAASGSSPCSKCFPELIQFEKAFGK